MGNKIHISSGLQIKSKLSGDYLSRKVGEVKYGGERIKGKGLQKELANLSSGGVSEGVLKRRLIDKKVPYEQRKKILSVVREKFTKTSNGPNKKSSFHEQAMMQKEAERKKLGKLARYKEAQCEEEEAYKSTKGAWEGEQRSGFGWQGGQKQQTEQDKGPGLDKGAFQGIGSSANKPAAPLPDTTPKAPPQIPLVGR